MTGPAPLVSGAAASSAPAATPRMSCLKTSNWCGRSWRAAAWRVAPWTSTCTVNHRRRRISGRSACVRHMTSLPGRGALPCGLSVAPLTGALLWRGAWGSLMLGIVAVWLLAAAGRSRAGGRHVFPFRAVVVAPLWVAERAVCTWLAVAAAATLGGIPYHGRIVAAAATPLHRLRARFKQSDAPSRA